MLNSFAEFQNQSQTINDKEDRFFVKNKLVVLRKVIFKQAIAAPANIISLDLQQVGFTSLNFLVQVLDKFGLLKYERFSMPTKANVCPNFMQSGDIGGLASKDGSMRNPEDYKQFNYLNGHIPWWPALAEITGAKGITAVRNPLGINGRAIADANFAYMRGYIKTKLEAETYIRSFVDNMQTRMIAGVEYMNGDCTDATLERAKANIDSFLLVWVTDADMNKFAEVLASMLNWGNIAMPERTQVSGDKIFAEQSDISPALQDYIQKANKYDLELYTYAKAKMESWLQENIAGYEEVGQEELVRCYLPDYAKDRVPYQVQRQEIDKWNESAEGLLETEQDWPDNYDDIKPSSNLPVLRM